MPAPAEILQQLPAVTQILERQAVRQLIHRHSREFVLSGIQEYLDTLRHTILSGDLSSQELAGRLQRIDDELEEVLERRLKPGLREVVNASGVILHTNVGRAPLDQGVARAILSSATSYSNLEYDLETGGRGHRDTHFEKHLGRLLQIEAATVCNNNAAAVFLILNTLASGRKVLVSRGELIEIGGSFRIPAILERSGALLAEVGTTNKTRVADYAEAIDERTALILRVHPSNYRVVGFAARPSLAQLVDLARTSGLPLVEDLGSGLIFPSEHPALAQEPAVQSSLAAGVDLVCFSGDKLLGGPQAGIIVGKARLVREIRHNPLMRACRVDKLTYAALERTLLEYERGTYRRTLPVHRMLEAPAQEVRQRATRMGEQLDPACFSWQVLPGSSLVGGGAAPGAEIPTYLLAVTSTRYSANQMEQRLRRHSPPVVARIEENRLLFDLRTVFPEQEPFLVGAFEAMAHAPSGDAPEERSDKPDRA